MRKIILLLISFALLFTACQQKEAEDRSAGLPAPDTTSCTIEPIAFPFGEWEIEDGEAYMWDCFLEEQYYIFEGNRENKEDVYQYTVYSYDLIDGTWEKAEFQWNALLKKNHVNLLGNYQTDQAGNIYFLGCKAVHKETESHEGRIYCVDTNGTLTQISPEKEMFGAGEEIQSFRLLEDGNYLVMAESMAEGFVYYADFQKGEAVKTTLPTGVDVALALNAMCILEDQVVYPYWQNEKECAVQFRKYKERVPEKIVVFDYDFSEEESVYLWNVSKSVQGEAYMLASKGLYEISGDTATQILGKKDLAPIFDKYNDVIYTKQAEEREYFCVVQNDKDIALFKIGVEK